MTSSRSWFLHTHYLQTVKWLYGLMYSMQVKFYRFCWNMSIHFKFEGELYTYRLLILWLFKHLHNRACYYCTTSCFFVILYIFSEMTPERSHEHWITSLDIDTLNGLDMHFENSKFLCANNWHSDSSSQTNPCLNCFFRRFRQWIKCFCTELQAH